MKPFLAAVLLALTAYCGTAPAAPLSIANEPLATAGNQIKPNIAMVIDDSGSMVYSFVPDTHMPPAVARRCDGDSAYNPLFFNPNTVYMPPYKIDGQPHPVDNVTRFPDAVLSNTLFDGYFPPGPVTFALTGANVFFDLSRLGQLSAEQKARLPNRPVCPDASASCTDEEKIPFYFSRNTFSPGSAACENDGHYELVTDNTKLGVPDPVTHLYGAREIARGQTNYANWFSYYRFRGSVMKQAVGEAFRDLDPDRFRVGLFFINSRTSGATVDYSYDYDLPITDFNEADRQRWYERLYGSRQAGWTPLRGALSRVGRMFAGQIPDSSDDGMPPAPAGTATTPTPAGAGSGIAGSTAGGAAGGTNSAGGTGTGTGTTGTSTTQLSTSGRPVFHWDPVQASCQKNQVIMATDGAWNHFAENQNFGPFGIDGQRIGDLDSGAAVPKPYRDTVGNAETLADVAYYFNNTDLRTTRCENTIGDKKYSNLCATQGKAGEKVGVRMRTSVIGLGISGKIPYTPANAADPAFLASIDWPLVYSDPTYPEDDLGKIDDIWHAAVNGGGTYFNASDPVSLQLSLKNALGQQTSLAGAGAALAVSSSVPSPASNFAYAVSYKNIEWSGDVTAYRFDAATGYSTIATTPEWSVQTKLLAARAGSGNWAANRKIRYFSPQAPGKLADFDVAHMDNATALMFQNFCSGQATPGQCGNGIGKLSPEQTQRANDSATLVAWLRGDSSNEIRPRTGTDDPAHPTGLYRHRDYVLGDIVNATPVYAGGPPFDYPYDPTYGAFKNENAGRRAMLYAGANDGMLHAFDANLGDELWAYVPLGVMRNMWRLADADYDARHQYLVDGRVVLGDVCGRLAADRRLCQSKEDWRSIMVAGLNKGGCSFYALDVTDPDQPKGLWEFSNNNLGYSFGEPIIGKLRNGTWVVVFASGYNQRYSNKANNCGATATDAASLNGEPESKSIADIVKFVISNLDNQASDGRGHVFVLNALTGEMLRDISTPLASEAGGLARLNAWFETPSVPEISRLYGGDLEGNLWRFDMDEPYQKGKPAVLVANLKDASGKPQPITTAPLPIRVTGATGTYPVILVGTGKYMAVDDATDIQLQTVYAIKDKPAIVAPVSAQPLTTPTVVLANSRGNSMMARSIQDLPADAGGLLTRTITGEAIDWDARDGWYTDLTVNGQNSGDRINVDMQVFDQTLTFLANTPSPNLCLANDGSASLYYVDMVTGLPVPQQSRDPANPENIIYNQQAGIHLPALGTATGFVITRDRSGKQQVHIVFDSSKVVSTPAPTSPLTPVPAIHRSSWRELVE